MNTQAYEQMCDEEIVAASQSGDKDATAYILDKYKGLVRGKTRGLFLIGSESEDLIQEGMIGLFEAVQNYSPDRDASFYSFAGLCVTRQLYSAVKAASRKKHAPLNGYVSLDQESETADGGEGLQNYLESLKAVSAEDLFIDRENTALTEKKIMEALSPLEKKVLGLYLNGVTYTEIAVILGINQKAVDNALQRIKNKTKKLVQQ